jgi:formylglycine-generating enzyme required for sulfatase activity
MKRPSIPWRLAAAALAGATACGDVPARPQLVVYVDTDLPVPAVADTLRIEQLDATGAVVASTEYVAPNESDWPLSFGVLPDRPILLRMRLFPAGRLVTSKSDATALGDSGCDSPVTGDYQYGDATIGDPSPGRTIDRLVELDASVSELTRVGLVLSGDCLALPASVERKTTCVGREHSIEEAPASAGVVILDDAPTPADSIVGTWTAAQKTQCSGTARMESGLFDEEICIPGGVYFLGDHRFDTVGCSPCCASVPERLVRMSPFYLDKYEVTVARWRDALARGFSPNGKWHKDGFCTFREDGSNDAFPMSCVTHEAATELCAFDGRELVSEVQWEHAASGRGLELMYVWGVALPDCSRAAYARVGPDVNPAYGGEALISTFLECRDAPGPGTALVNGNQGPFPAGSFAGNGQDRSLDGVLDMNANLREWVRDTLMQFDRGCWGARALFDPVCLEPFDPNRPWYSQRGASWGGGTGQLGLAWRAGGTNSFDGQPGAFQEYAAFVGFRCSREATP